jgi:hypothetical protein
MGLSETSAKQTASLDPGAIRLIFMLDKCLECRMTEDRGCFWRFASGLTLTLQLPDESKLRFVPHWHIGEA